MRYVTMNENEAFKQALIEQLGQFESQHARAKAGLHLLSKVDANETVAQQIEAFKAEIASIEQLHAAVLADLEPVEEPVE